MRCLSSRAKQYCRVSVAALITGFALAQAASAQTTAFIYQGKLTVSGNPADGNYDLQFKLFDAVGGGTQQGATLTRPSVAVSDGVLTISLDFGAPVFDGAARYMEIGSGNSTKFVARVPQNASTAPGDSEFAALRCLLRKTFTTEHLGACSAHLFCCPTACTSRQRLRVNRSHT